MTAIMTATESKVPSPTSSSQAYQHGPSPNPTYQLKLVPSHQQYALPRPMYEYGVAPQYKQVPYGEHVMHPQHTPVYVPAPFPPHGRMMPAAAQGYPVHMPPNYEYHHPGMAAHYFPPQEHEVIGRKRPRQEMSMDINYLPAGKKMPRMHEASVGQPYHMPFPPHPMHTTYYRTVPSTSTAVRKGGKREKKSIYRGVFWNNQGKVWISSITSNGKKKHLGCFDSENEAALAYDREALKIKGDLATLNFSDSAARFKLEKECNLVMHSTRHVRRTAEKVSAFRGVCWNKYNQSWKACIKVNGKNKHLGYFNSEESAAKAYDEICLIHRGPKAKLNFPVKEEDKNVKVEDKKEPDVKPKEDIKQEKVIEEVTIKTEEKHDVNEGKEESIAKLT